MLKGALAAAVTPLVCDGLDVGAFAPYVDFLVAGDLDGLLALGTTGEGILLTPVERRRVVELYVTASAGRLQIAAHCGAQTTRDTVARETPACEATISRVGLSRPIPRSTTPLTLVNAHHNSLRAITSA